jgi:drug/metabolite transporter (DMT)-like permease
VTSGRAPLSARASAPSGPARARRALASPYLSLLLVTVLWGALHPLGKLVMRDVSPVQLILVRVVFAGLTLSMLLALQGKGGEVVRELRRRPGTLLQLGFFSFFASSGSSMIALSLLPASVSSLLTNASPLFVAVGTMALARRRFRRLAVAGVLIGFLGLGTVVFGEDPAGFGQLDLNPVGVGLALISSLAWAIYIVRGQRAMEEGNPLAVVVGSSLFGGLAWLLIAAVHGDLLRFAQTSAFDWGLLLYLGVIATGLTYGLWTAALTRLPAESVAVFQYLIPFWAVLLSVLLLADHLTVPLVLGGVAIVAGIAIAQRSTK